MSDTYYPPVSFYFELKVLGTPRSPWVDTEIDASFQEVSGLDRELELQPLAEGGENRFTHQLPKRGKHPNLVLKRGMTDSDTLWKWHQDVVNGKVERKSVTLILWDESVQDTPWRWSFTGAYPVKWGGPDLKADGNAVAIETLELVHNGFSKVER
jgi:phage tail-like protein